MPEGFWHKRTPTIDNPIDDCLVWMSEKVEAPTEMAGNGANQERFLGALLGMAIGDALGMPVAGWSAARIRERFGRIDVLHNNVGIAALGGVVEESEESWDTVLRVNLKSVFLTCKHVIPHMESAGGG